MPQQANKLQQVNKPVSHDTRANQKATEVVLKPSKIHTDLASATIGVMHESKHCTRLVYCISQSLEIDPFPLFIEFPHQSKHNELKKSQNIVRTTLKKINDALY